MIKKEPAPKIVVIACLKSSLKNLENIIKFCIDHNEIEFEKTCLLIDLYINMKKIVEELK